MIHVLARSRSQEEGGKNIAGKNSAPLFSNGYASDQEGGSPGQAWLPVVRAYSVSASTFSRGVPRGTSQPALTM